MSSAFSPRNPRHLHRTILIASLLCLGACGGGGSDASQVINDPNSAWYPYVGTWSTGCQQRQGSSYSSSTPGATQAVTIQVAGTTGSQATLTVTEKEWTTTDCSGATSFEVTTSGSAVLSSATKQFYNNAGWWSSYNSGSSSANAAALLGTYTFNSWQLSVGSLATSGPTLGVTTAKFGFFVSNSALYVLKGPSFDANGYPDLVSRYSTTRQ